MSVAITNYNYGRYVGEAIESVLAQTRPADQIVVVDDGSTDDSRSVLAAFADVAEVHHTPNGGLIAATNYALERCTGDVVALLDADDLMTPRRVERLVEVYDANPDVQWVCNALSHIDRATREPLDSTPRLRNFLEGRHDHRRALARGRFPMDGPAASGLSWRLPFVRSLLPIPEGTRNQDAYLMFPSVARAPGYVLEEPLTLQGIHGENMYTTAAGRQRAVYRAEHTVSLVLGYEALGADLQPTADALTAAALLLSRFGVSLSPPQRSRLRAHLMNLPARRWMRICMFLARGAAISARDAVRH